MSYTIVYKSYIMIACVAGRGRGGEESSQRKINPNKTFSLDRLISRTRFFHLSLLFGRIRCDSEVIAHFGENVCMFVLSRGCGSKTAQFGKKV